MSPKIAFVVCLFGCALLALVNAERPYPSPPNYQQYNPRRQYVNPYTRMAEEGPNGKCCPCPSEGTGYPVEHLGRHVNHRMRLRTIDTPKNGGCCPCPGVGATDEYGTAAPFDPAASVAPAAPAAPAAPEGSGGRGPSGHGGHGDKTNPIDAYEKDS